MNKKIRMTLASMALLPLVAGCTSVGEYEIEDNTPTIEFAPQAVGFSEGLPDGWSVEDGVVATKDSCVVSPTVHTITHVGMPLGDDAVANATFLNRYAYEVIPETASLSKMTVDNALGEELEFLVYQFDREMITVDPENTDEHHPDTIKKNVRSMVALRGISQAIDTYDPSDPDNKDGRKPINPVLSIDGYCDDPADFEPDTMKAVAELAVFVEGPDPALADEEMTEESNEETP